MGLSHPSAEIKIISVGNFLCKKKDFGKQGLQKFLDALFDDEQGSGVLRHSLQHYLHLVPSKS